MFLKEVIFKDVGKKDLCRLQLQCDIIFECTKENVPTKQLLLLRAFRRNGEGTVFTGVCLSQGVPHLHPIPIILPSTGPISFLGGGTPVTGPMSLLGSTPVPDGLLQFFEG